jgi:hypothetical protein
MVEKEALDHRRGRNPVLLAVAVNWVVRLRQVVQLLRVILGHQQAAAMV